MCAVLVARGTSHVVPSHRRDARSAAGPIVSNSVNARGERRAAVSAARRSDPDGQQAPVHFLRDSDWRLTSVEVQAGCTHRERQQNQHRSKKGAWDHAAGKGKCGSRRVRPIFAEFPPWNPAGHYVFAGDLSELGSWTAWLEAFNQAHRRRNDSPRRV
jgi:hypothetical protein